MADGSLLYVRSDKGNGVLSEDQENVWDDTLLIRAYDKAINSAKEKLMKTLGAQENEESNVDSSSVVEEGEKSKKRKKKTWKVGSSCRAVYDEDGEEYEAQIVKILKSGKSCFVRFYGYGNEAKVYLDDLLPSLGKQEIELQKRCAKEEKLGWSVGDICRSTYSEDGIEYEAEIIKISLDENVALIRFVGYGNQQEVSLDNLSPSLGPKEVELQVVRAHTELAMNQASRANGFVERPFSRSDGKGLQNGYTSPSQVMPPPSAPTIYYEAAASGSSQAPSFSGTHHFNKNKGNIPLPLLAPPPSIEMMQHGPRSETEALTAMLMSWYMSGYHTGYYQGLKHAKTMNYNTKNNRRKNNTASGKSRNSPSQKKK